MLVCDGGRCHVTLLVMFQFSHLKVLRLKNKPLKVLAEWGTVRVIPPSQQQRNMGIHFICSKVSQLIIFKTSVRLFESVKLQNNISCDIEVLIAFVLLGSVHVKFGSETHLLFV
jgi:hypothetical protein